MRNEAASSLKPTCSRGSAPGRWPASRRRWCWICCARSRRAAPWTLPTGSSKPAGWCSAMPLPPGMPIATPSLTCAAPDDPAKLGELLRAVAGYGGHPVTRAALTLAALTFQRPGNVLAMRWADVDLDAGVWTIPAQDMKRTKQAKASGPDHVVPLAAQAVAVLRELQPLTSVGAYCFPNLRTKGRPISNVTMN